MKKQVLTVLGVLVASILAICLVFSLVLHGFMVPGVQVVGGYAHVELQETCWFVKPGTTEFEGNTTFTASGILLDNEHGEEMDPFSGMMHVEAYPIAPEEIYGWIAGKVDSKWITLSCQQLRLQNPDCAYFYMVHILKSNPEVIVVYIYTGENQNLIAVCGDTEAQAKENYQIYLEEFK